MADQRAWKIESNVMRGDYLSIICYPYFQKYGAVEVTPGPEDDNEFDMEKDVLDYFRRKNVTEEAVLSQIRNVIEQRVAQTAINYAVIFVDHPRRTVVLVFVLA